MARPTNYHGEAAARAFEHERMKRQVDAQHAHRRAELVRGVPSKLRASIMAAWAAKNETDFHGAERDLRRSVAWVADVRRRIPERIVERVASRDTLSDHSSDESVRAWAARRAGECGMVVDRAADEAEAYCQAREYVTRWRIEPPPLRDGDPLAPSIARMIAKRWWRQQARRLLSRDIESRALAAGRVHRRAGVYVSDLNLQRGRDQDQRNAQTLLDLVAENELGEQVGVAEMVERSTANPHIRLCELMVRLKGMEAVSDRMGYVGEFVTITLPSRFHARQWESGAENPKWDGSTPRDGQMALRNLWTLVRANLAKMHARYFGLRVAEPHHDGCPHWHMLLFVAPQDRDAVVGLIRRYALLESPTEPGAQEHRFKTETIDKAKGGATSYVAKYISKMTTGAGLKATSERGGDGVRRDTAKPHEGALRARRWASVWGIRQFQAFGTPPIGIWRELRRLDEAATLDDAGRPLSAQQQATFERARAAADASQYGEHLMALGGAALPRAEQRMAVWRRQDGDLNAYGEVRPAVTAGVCFRLRIALPLKGRQRVRRFKALLAGWIKSRLHSWIIKPKPAAVDVAVSSDPSGGPEIGAPRTRVNNCNHPSPLCLSDQGQNLGHPPDLGPIPALQSENSSHERTGNHPHPGR